MKVLVGKSPRRRGTPLPDLERRRRAVEKTMAKYRGKPFALGTRDCVTMARSHLVAMGHKGLPKPARYSTEAGARRELARLGAATLEELFDGLLPRIAPAAMLPGDLALVEAEPGEAAADVGTIGVSVGRKMIGWHPDQAEMAVMDVSAIRAAWRC